MDNHSKLLQEARELANCSVSMRTAAIIRALANIVKSQDTRLAQLAEEIINQEDAWSIREVVVAELLAANTQLLCDIDCVGHSGKSTIKRIRKLVTKAKAA